MRQAHLSTVSKFRRRLAGPFRWEVALCTVARNISVINGPTARFLRAILPRCSTFKEALVAATKEIGLEVNALETKYMTVSRDQNAVRIHTMKTDNSYIERVEEFKY